MLEDPITELTVSIEIDYFQLNRAEYFVPIIVKIPAASYRSLNAAAPNTL